MAKKRCSGVLVLVAAAATATLASPEPAQGQESRPPTPVTIVAPVPLPVSGTITLGGEGLIKVSNLPTEPVPTRDVDRAAAEPFSHTFQIDQTTCVCTNCCFPSTAAVPAGKRLIIQHVSGYVSLESAGNLGPVTLRQVNPGPPIVATTLVTIPVSSRVQWNGGDYPAYEFSHAVQVHVDAGNTVNLRIFGSSSWGFTGGLVTVSGLLVNVP